MVVVASLGGLSAVVATAGDGAGVVLMRAAGCVINDHADRQVDGHVQRTAQRPLPAGQLTARQALVFFVLLAGLAFLLVLTLNRQTIALSVVGLLLAVIYPFMKRVTHLPQLVLGLAFSWSIPMAWVAVANELTVTTWLFVWGQCAVDHCLRHLLRHGGSGGRDRRSVSNRQPYCSVNTIC